VQGAGCEVSESNPMGYPGPMFFVYARAGIEIMTRAGLSESDITGVLNAVRAGAIYEERLRVEHLHSANAPYFCTDAEMQAALDLHRR
jgi:hypothetical protein